MKQNWEYKNIEDCLEKVRITPKLQTKDFLSKGLFPIISQESDYISGYWNDPSDVFHLSHPIVIFGDHSRVVKYVDFDFVVGADGVKILSPKGFINPKFLYYFVKFIDIPSLGYSRHYKLLREVSVPIPPLEEQQRIVAELDLLTGIIDKQKTQLKELDTLAQSIFYDMFGDPIENEKGWDVKKLGDELNVVGGYAFKSNSFVNVGIPVLRIGNINSGVLKINQVVFYDENEKLTKYIVYPNDLVISLTGTAGKDDYGNICRLNKSFPKYYLNQRNAKLDLGNKLQPFYVQYLFKDKKVKGSLTAVNRGVRQGNISNKDIENLKVPIPPLALQQEFADKIQSIEKQKAAINLSIADTQKLLDYTMDKYFG